jgi:hypothetical protein
MVLPVTISSNLLFPEGYPVAAYVFFLLFFLSIPLFLE